MVEINKKKEKSELFQKPGQSLQQGVTGRGTQYQIGNEQIVAKPGEQIQERKTGRGTVITKGTEPRSFTITSGGKSTTFFGKSPPPGLEDSQNVTVNTPEEQARLADLTPQERLAEQKVIQFEKGMQTGSFEGLSVEETTQMARERGFEGVEGNVATPQDKSFLDKAAQFGVAPAVFGANIISRALKGIAGLDIGTITREEFASSTVGKSLGLATVAAEAVLLGRFAASLLPAKGAVTTITTAPRAAVGVNVLKTGMLSKFGSAKTLVGLAITGWGVTKIEGAVSDRETSVVNIRESLTLVTQAVNQGVLDPTEAILLYDELEEDINREEGVIKTIQNFSIKSYLGKGQEVDTRIQKARLQLNVERGRFLALLGGQSIQ